MEKREEERLVRRVQRRGDRAAAEALIEAYYREIYAFAYRQTGDMELAMDLTQDVFLAMLQSIPAYRSSVASFRTWLYRIASNKIVDYFRSSYYKNRCSAVDPGGIVLPAELTPEEAYIDAETTRRCLTALAALPFASQQVLRLKLFAGATFREIAETLSLPESTVKTQYYSAIKTLRKEVD